MTAKITRLKIIHRVSNSIQTRFSFLGTSIQRNTCLHAGGSNQLAWQVTMSSWFISPWEAARFSLEAQCLIALQFFPFAPRKGQPHQEEASGNRKAVVPGLGSSADCTRYSRDRGIPYRQGQLRPATTRTLLGRRLAFARQKAVSVKGKTTSNGARENPRTACD